MEDIKVKTKSGKAVHYGIRGDLVADGVAGIAPTCGTGLASTVWLEADTNAEISCKVCLKSEPIRLALYAARPAQESTPTEVPAPQVIGTIRISADMETILNAASHSTSLKTARAAGVTWGAGKLNVTAEGRDALLWFLEMRAEIAREALSDGRRVYPARRAEWHAAVKLNRQASYILAA
jgi:hypothetical protein